MKNYIIGIGGSGSRVLRAVIHYCAAGIIREDELKVMVIDADQNSAAWKRLKTDYESYQEMHGLFRENPEGCFRTKIDMLAEKNVISPVEYDKMQKLRDVLQGNPKLERMMKWLYTETEMIQDLKEGFFARPNVGCVFFSNFHNHFFTDFLEEAMNSLVEGEQVNIILAGSIFGGTGASGLPTILKLIDMEVKKAKEKHPGMSPGNLKVGSVFMLPYFTAKKRNQESNPLIEMEKFNMTAKEALKYYKAEKYFDRGSGQGIESFHSLYLVGQNTLDIVNVYATGGEEQDNKPHIAEACAALAIHDFWHRVKSGNQAEENGANIFLHTIGEVVKWDNLPFENGAQKKNMLQKRMGQLARFSTIYDVCIYQYLKRKSNKSFMMYHTPQWYVVYLSKEADVAAQKNIYTYCKSYLEWIYMIQETLEIDNDGEGMQDRHYQHNDNMQLFGKILSEICNYIRDNEKESDGENFSSSLREIKRSFGQLVCEGKNIGYAVKKIFMILSKLGIIGVLGGNKGISGLVNCLYQLIG